jgi:fucose permease
MSLDISFNQIFALSFGFWLGMFAARFVGLALMEMFAFISALLLGPVDDDNTDTQ